MPCSSQGAISKLAIGGQQIPFEMIDDQTTRKLVDDNDEVITGYMDPLSQRVSLGQLDIVVNVRLRPTPLELTALFPQMGMTLDTGVWGLDESLASFTMIIDRVAKVHTYATCYVNQWTLSGQKGTKPLALDLQIVGTSLTEGNAGSFSATALTADGPYPFTAGVLTLRSSTRQFDRFSLSVNHFVERNFENSLTVSCADMTRRRVTLATSVPYVSANTDLFTTPLASAAGAAATLVFTKGGQSTSIAITNLKEIARPPGIPGKMAIRLPLFMRAYRTTSTKTFATTHDDSV